MKIYIILLNSVQNFTLCNLLQKTSCNCHNNNQTNGTLFETERCDQDKKVLCKQTRCVVYRRG